MNQRINIRNVKAMVLLLGIIQKVEYFKEIGVDTVCLAPVFRSPMVDFGYDISDFRDIDPTFGTLDDFKDLIENLKALGKINFGLTYFIGFYLIK